MSDLSFISFPLPSYKIDIDWPNKRSFHSQSFLFKLNSYVQMTSNVIYQEIFQAKDFSSVNFISTSISQKKQVWICPLKRVWWPVLDLDVQDDGWICEMTFVFVSPSQIWDCDMCTGYLVVICRTVLLLHLHNVSYKSHT